MSRAAVVKQGSEQQEAEMGKNGKVLTELLDFIGSAERMGNYPTNTAGGMKAALRTVSSVLTDEEAESLDTFKSHLEAIFQRVFNKNKSRISAPSLKVYQTRINTVLSDYELYGRSPQAMAGWKRKVRITAPRRPNGAESARGIGLTDVLSQTGQEMSRHEIPLRPNVKAILLLPVDLNETEAGRLKVLIDACVTQ